MSIETLITDLTAAIRELTATMAAAQTPLNAGGAYIRELNAATAASQATTPVAEAPAAPAKRGPGRPKKEEPVAEPTPVAEVPVVKTAATDLYFKDTSTERGVIVKSGWPLPSMERLVEITKDDYTALEAPKVAEEIAIDTVRTKVLEARDELTRRLVKSGKSVADAQSESLNKCKDMLKAVTGFDCKTSDIPVDKRAAVLGKAGRLLADMGAMSFDIPTDDL